MRASIRVSGLLAFSLFLVPLIFAQTNPPPSDPHELVRSTLFNATGFQQEVFISVQFHLPAQQMGGVPVLHSSVHWVIWEHRGKSSPRKPVRDAA